MLERISAEDGVLQDSLAERMKSLLTGYQTEAKVKLPMSTPTKRVITFLLCTDHQTADGCCERR